jgi:CBS domain-containing protein
MKCKDLMKKNIIFVSPEDSLQYAAELMRDENVGFLPVCDDSRRVLGVLTDRDIVVRAIAANLPNSTLCIQVMTKNVAECRGGDDISTALGLMKEHKVSRVCCVDGNDSILGVISMSDVAELGRDHEVAEMLREVTERER